MSETYSIGQFSKKTGTTIRTLHYYDELELLKPSIITESGRRYYADENIVQLQKIISLKFLGYSLEDIKEFLHLNDWNLMDSLLFQKDEMLKKKAHIERVIRALDQAIDITESQGQVDSSIFLMIIQNIQMEEEFKDWLKSLLPSDRVEEIYNISDEKQRELNRTMTTTCIQLKEAAGSKPEDPAVQELVGQLFMMTAELLGGEDVLFQEIIENEQISEEDLDNDPLSLASPFSKEEEEWLAKAMEIYLLNRGADEYDSE
ncbi:MAG: MerR family transcriptional regulator [Cytobacillus gottheilii]|uniref:MerR family transcriptional regulator n=1 Tax=Cytobacillus gottheilii TaxID=859144 RepID=UPI000830B176|nr:MerR family transcriptional regulator [Cytobacillus gottheilii]